MRKIRCFLIFVLIVLSLLTLSYIHAQESDFMAGTGTAGSWIGKLEINPDSGLPVRFENLTDDELRKEYLKREWTKLLENSKIGPPLLAAQAAIKKADPVFIILLGIRFTFSWLFILTLITYVFLIELGFDIKLILKNSLGFRQSPKVRAITHWTFFIIFFIFISTCRIPYFIANFLINWVSNDLHWIVQIIIFVIIFLIIAFFRLIEFKTIKWLRKEWLKKEVKLNKEDIKDNKKDTKEDISKTNAIVAKNSAFIKQELEDKKLKEEAEADFDEMGADNE